jgi:hypothetical protein
VFTPAELMFGCNGPNIFENFLPKTPERGRMSEDVQTNIAKTYEKIAKKIDARK